MVSKGTVSALYEGGKKASVKPYLGEVVTVRLVVPFYLLECLTVGMAVVYAQFEDNTGVVLARMDGEWNHKVWKNPEGAYAVQAMTGDVEVVEGAHRITAGDQLIPAGDMVTGAVASYNAHTHTCPDGGTTGPK